MSKKQKILSCALSAALLAGAIPVAVSASNDPHMVRIVVENNTKTEEGTAWSGTLVDKWVELKDDSTAVSLFTELAQSEGFTQTGADSGYITEIGGLSAEGMGGWMFGVDDWYGNSGISAFKASDGTLEDGDEIFFSYSMNWGVDIGADFYNTSTKLSSLTSDSGEIETSGDNSFVLKLPEGTETVRLTPTAENKNYRYKIYKNEYAPESADDYKRSEDIPVDSGDTIYIGVGHASWHSYLPEGVTETVYEVAVEIDGEEESSENSESSQSSESSVEEGSQTSDQPSAQTGSAERILDEISERIRSTDFVNIGNEWELMTLARLDRLSEDEKSEFAAKLADSMEENPPVNATELAKNFIVIASFGGEHYKMFDEAYISRLADLENASKQGINGVVFSLLALDTGAVQDEMKAEKDAMVSAILDAQLEDGGWTFYGDVYDPDMTGMAIQALAPCYLSGRNDVMNAVDKAVELLSSAQNDNGTYSSYGSENCESTAQVVTALSAINIDADKDERFIKNGRSALEGLESFYLSGQGSFSHTAGEEANKYSTAQGYYALCAYYRFAEGMTRLYDMSDVIGSTQGESEIESEPESSAESSAEETASEASSAQSSVPSASSAVSASSSSVSSSSSAVQTFATADSTSVMIIFVVIAASAAAVLFIIARKRRA